MGGKSLKDSQKRNLEKEYNEGQYQQQKGDKM